MKATIRQIKAIPTLMHWRKEVIENVFGIVPSKRLLAASRRYYLDNIADGSHIAVVAEIDGTDAGCGAICMTDELPSPDNPTGRCAYLMNIYVKKEFRGRGFARSIVEWLVNKAREENCGKIWLETTGMAQQLYRKTRFRELPGIMKYEDIQNS